MVTRIVVLRSITPAERASAAEESNRDDINQLQNKEQDDDGDDEDDDKYDTKEEDQSFRGCLSIKAADGGFCDGHSSQDDVSSHCKPNDDKRDEGKAVDDNATTSKKRPLLLGDEDADDNGKKKHRNKKQKFIDLTDVPPQSPILRSYGRIKEGSSKYQGVAFNKASSKWVANIMIGRVQHYLGQYDDEEEAAIDYARALFKYKAGEAGKTHHKSEKKRQQQFIDLTDVPPQPPILKSGGHVKDGASRYQGVTFRKANNKWLAIIMIGGVKHYIGSYDDEEEAAIDYARAKFKFKAEEEVKGKTSHKTKQQFIDLTDVPPQPPILRSDGHGKEGASKYQGVTFNKANNKWLASIMIGGVKHYIGSYDDEEEAAIDYARTKFKFKAEEEVKGKTRHKTKQQFIDLTDVPPQPPILKSDGHVKEGASKYQGVTFNKRNSIWVANIMIDKVQHYLGQYDDEEEAAIDYARAVFKYKSGITPNGRP